MPTPVQIEQQRFQLPGVEGVVQRLAWPTVDYVNATGRDVGTNTQGVFLRIGNTLYLVGMF